MILFVFITSSVLELCKCIDIGKLVVLVSKLPTSLEFMFSPFFDIENISENNISLLLQYNWKNN